MDIIDKILSDFKKKEDKGEKNKISIEKKYDNLLIENEKLLLEIEKLTKNCAILNAFESVYRKQIDEKNSSLNALNVLIVEKDEKIKELIAENNIFHLQLKNINNVEKIDNVILENIIVETELLPNHVLTENYFSDNNSWNKFVKKGVKKYGDKFTYPKNDYENCKSRIKLVCKLHGEFTTDAKAHLQTISGGCKGCLKYKSQYSLYTKQEEGDNRSEEFFTDEEFDLIMNELKN